MSADPAAPRTSLWVVPAIAGTVFLAVLVALGVAGYVAYQRYTVSYTVERESDGVTISKVVDAKLAGATDLRVSRLTGTVQATASDVGWGGVLPSGLVFKAPFEADYFVDLAKLDRSRFFWNAKTRTLIVTPPDVRVDSVNVDEARASVDQTTGLLVTRGAMARLRQRASGRAAQVVRTTATNAKNMVQAREAARREIADLYQRPLTIAGLDAHVVVQFDGEGRRNSEQWDRSRSLDEILAAGK
jgi:ketosteroid isomerase-like protein